MPTSPEIKQDLLLQTMKKFIGRKLLEVSLEPLDKRSFELKLTYEEEGEVTHIVLNTFDITFK